MTRQRVLLQCPVHFTEGRYMGQRSAVLLALTALGWSVFTLVAPGVVLGQASQPASRPVARVGAQPADDLIALNFPESVEIKVLADYVSRRLDLNIIYGEDVGAQRVILRTPARISSSSATRASACTCSAAGRAI